MGLISCAGSALLFSNMQDDKFSHDAAHVCAPDCTFSFAIA